MKMKRQGGERRIGKKIKYELVAETIRIPEQQLLVHYDRYCLQCFSFFLMLAAKI